ncbi:hypothetical protein BVC80_285g109 [Macleaya cordata]|uniref:CLAVATA3/ESR (CLE)-related protein 45 n=1 Tax=Macleaya cordata TaxID=56857 RepID=A0A200QSF4_MACCD|nr:hypothetical protein BVC80_285g109 [Macleaya cordata]
MGFCAYRVLILIVCIGYLFFQPGKVSASRSINLVLKEEQGVIWKNSRALDVAEDLKTKKNSALRSIDMVLNDEQGIQPKNSRLLNSVSVEDLKTKKNSSTVSRKLDPFNTSKRRVRRGSDPIHNRS